MNGEGSQGSGIGAARVAHVRGKGVQEQTGTRAEEEEEKKKKKKKKNKKKKLAYILHHRFMRIIFNQTQKCGAQSILSGMVLNAQLRLCP